MATFKYSPAFIKELEDIAANELGVGRIVVSTDTDTTPEAQVHIRYDGQSLDYPMSQFDFGPADTDEIVKTGIAASLNVPPEKLENYTVEREPNGNMTLYPRAEFG